MIDDLWRRIGTRLNQPVLPDPVWLAVERAQERWQAGERRETLARLLAAVEGHPNAPATSLWSGRFTLATLALEDNLPELAESALLPLLSATGLTALHNTETYHLYAKILDALDRPAEAHDAREKRWLALEKHPHTLERVVARANLLQADGVYGDALELYRAALPHSDSLSKLFRAQAFAWGAFASLMEGDFATALTWMQFASRLAPTELPSEVFLSHTYRLTGDLDLSLDVAEAALARAKRSGDHRDQAHALAEIAIGIHLSGKSSLALTILDDADALFPTLPQTYWHRANILNDRERYDLLRQELDNPPAGISPDGPNALLYRTTLDAEAGDFSGALLRLGKAGGQCVSRYDRYSVEAVRVDFLVRGERLDEAEALVEQLDTDRSTFASSRPTEATYLRALATLRAGQGRHQEAFDVAKSLLRIGVEPIYQPRWWHFAGDQLAALGEFDGARLAWKNAANSTAESPWVSRAIETLAEV